MAGKWITRADKPARLMVWVDGEIDIDNAGQLREFLATELTHDDITEVVLDMSAVTFIDTSGLHSLIATARRADLLTCEFSLILEPAGCVQRLLELTNTISLFTVRPSMAAAVPAVPPTATRIPVLPQQRSTLPHLREVTPTKGTTSSTLAEATTAVTDLRTETPLTQP